LRDKNTRQKAYRQFIEEASKLYADALVDDDLQIYTLGSAYALISRMRVLPSPPVIQKAEAAIRTIAETYFAPNKTYPELRTLLDRHAIDPLRAFSEECSTELESLESFRDIRVRLDETALTTAHQGVEQVKLNQGAARRTVRVSGSTCVQ
jgi:hypothetical protein